MLNQTNLMELSPAVLLRAYSLGIFPMAKNRTAKNVHWIEPKMRAIFPLEKFHISRSLMKTVRKNIFSITCDKAFTAVLERCAAPSTFRSETWINSGIKKAVSGLFEMGNAHSIETWYKNELVGGLYGISIGGAFFGESMFSLMNNSSKVALAHLIAFLRLGNFRLLDAQFITDHLSRFGAIQVTSNEYLKCLETAIKTKSIFPAAVDGKVTMEELELIYQAGRH